MIFSNDTEGKESAVSPVVGVMLMLVVVIIIAALVSAFAGNLMQNNNQVPQATISGSYSQAKGLTMTHQGGDSLSTKEIEIYIRRSEEFGGGASELSSMKLNFSTISTGAPVHNESVYWFEQFGSYGVLSWQPGESMYIINDGSTTGGDVQKSGLDIGNAIPYYEAFDQASGDDRFYINYLNNQFNIGKTLTLEVYTKDGKLISSSDMKIQP